MLFLIRCASPLLLVPDGSLNAIPSPRHTHLSLNISLAFSMVLDPLPSLDGKMFDCFLVLLCFRNPLLKVRLGTMKI